MRKTSLLVLSALLLIACDEESTTETPDAGPVQGIDAGPIVPPNDAGPPDSGPVVEPEVDAGTDAGIDAGPSDAGIDAAPAGGEVVLLDNEDTYFGFTVEQLIARWWQWLYAHPSEGHPVFDTTGEHCMNGQADSGPILLAGTYDITGTVERTCTIPRDRPVFFPIVNIETSNGGYAPGMYSDAVLERAARTSMDGMDVFTLEIDGQRWSTNDLREHRETARFTYDVTETHPNVYDTVYETEFSGHVDPAYSDGFWAYFAALPPGQHEIHFTAHDARSPSATDDFDLDVTYHLTVE